MNSYNKYKSGSGSSKSGQISIEFIAYFGLLAIIAILAYFIISSMKTSEVGAKEFYLAKMIGNSFIQSLSIGVEGGSGFSYVFNVPQMTGTVTTKYDFVINPDKNVALIEWISQSGKNLSYIFNIPKYKYDFSNAANCFENDAEGYRFKSNCTDEIRLFNDGSTLFIDTKNIAGNGAVNAQAQ